MERACWVNGVFYAAIKRLSDYVSTELIMAQQQTTYNLPYTQFALTLLPCNLKSASPVSGGLDRHLYLVCAVSLLIHANYEECVNFL